jgi:pimeloyl-ACP methyl ester carboxylesterase
MPFLGILASELEEMGFGTLPRHVMPFLPEGSRCEILEGVGHFVHIEQPHLVADMALEFIDSHPVGGAA